MGFEIEDLNNLIDKIEKAMELLADIDIYNYGITYVNKMNQKKLNKSYDL